ncbi:acetyl xylan esterase [Salmonella enterica subsp. enterica serovar Java]|uniref:Acetyl xylan esterase n=1 Tax=Salmonella enterica subsp. enterica serovar Java TaxID=224729 RepID=A0A5X7C0U3_SALEB|nr:acetyl xylan esterase [Salmonella enterica subsp. enterica serovar Java]EAA8238750.1 acetyl xylan esterase [Salmonella enterica]EBG2486229.1 acetyl xylan esterase [Salmonella enterica subsp. enterica serovar Szentes]EBP4220831.1 acetyl xylan esterase [Salmonella enterica subsp. enterica]ECH8127438.1 acetyl xylan esterase [Salmonella enterica subsp. enterica serovar Paratyphi B]ECS7910320.1 acetyl xylan esterase [Salmonella enterica subsp. enterica serovar Typhimurium]EDU8799830.1 acetyl xy
MQVQKWPQAAPRQAQAQAQARSAGARRRMQNHAPFGCIA